MKLECCTMGESRGLRASNQSLLNQLDHTKYKLKGYKMPANQELPPDVLHDVVRVHHDGELLIRGQAAIDTRRVARAITKDRDFMESAGVYGPRDLEGVAARIADLMRFRLFASTDEVSWHAIEPSDFEVASRQFAPKVLDSYAARPDLHRERMQAEGKRQSNLGAAVVGASGEVRKWLGKYSPTGRSAKRLAEIGEGISWGAAYEIIDMKRELRGETDTPVADPVLTPEGQAALSEDSGDDSTQPPAPIY